MRRWRRAGGDEEEEEEEKEAVSYACMGGVMRGGDVVRGERDGGGERDYIASGRERHTQRATTRSGNTRPPFQSPCVIIP